MKVVTVVGARPQFIKAALVSRAMKKAGINEVLVNTGQHYDYNMSKKMFEDLCMDDPKYDLEIGSMKQVEQVAAMMEKLAPIVAKEKPEMVLVYGDTNSTLAGALVACKMKLDLAHVEAGLRSFDRTMQEEINRILTDRVSTLLFCPTKTAIDNLRNEGMSEGVYNVGDIMYELAMNMADMAAKRSGILEKLKIEAGKYVLATVHRAANTDSPSRLTSIVRGLSGIKGTVVFPVHPRTRKMLEKFDLLEKLEKSGNIKITEPVGYLDMIDLERNARKIITDSGGVQKEAYFFKVPCITLRDRTEWTETLGNGWNRLVDVDFKRIVTEASSDLKPGRHCNHYGDGDTSSEIIKILKKGVKKDGKGKGK
ncbi:MAG TPA: UDP-N-acetylglucosamine 2-epimerase (non-hydrolyzing) [Candidatus Omnitrophota bacterium]|nr:UDP-N-acetylglucosamine 2-epimerase (non-hydrolyzing) [Candidatus Omnitrophota bacterium]